MDELLRLQPLLVTVHYCNLLKYFAECMHLGKNQQINYTRIRQEARNKKRHKKACPGLDRLYDKVKVRQLTHPPTSQHSPLKLVHVGSVFELALEPWSFHPSYLIFGFTQILKAE